MHTTSKYAFLIGVLAFASVATADELELQAVRAAAPPKIDGKLDDACWANAGRAETFLLNTTNQPATEKTEALVCYDDNTLYVGFICHESEPDKIVARETKDGGKAASDDCVELFLDPAHDHFNYLHFIVNPLGAQYDEAGDGAGVDATWDAPWQSAAQRTPDGWVAEMAIPFAGLGINKHVGAVWGINFCREERPKGELSTWSPLKGKFAQPASFGKLSGLNTDFSPFLVSLNLEKKLEAFSGDNKINAKVSNASAAPRGVILELTVAGENAPAQTIKSETLSLAPGADMSVSLRYSLTQPGVTRLTLRALEAGTGRLLSAVARRVELPPLAEFFLFESYYRNDAVLRVKLNARTFAKHSVTAELRPEKQAAPTPIANRAPFKDNVQDVVFDVSKLPVGNYVVRVSVIGLDGKAAASEDLPFARLRAPGSKPGRVAIREDNMLLLDGKPFFPLGIYYLPLSDKGLAEAAKAGFNLFHYSGGPSPKAMRKIEESGLMIWLAIGGLLKFDKDKEQTLEKLKKTVADYKNEKCLLVWESVDEPVWGSNTAGLLEGYRALKALDPDRPVWTNHAPRNTITELSRFDAATDITGCDIYPVPEPQSQSDLPNKTISVVADETEKQQTTVADRKPVWMVLQGFAWAELWENKGVNTPPVYPTFEQSRFMAYDAIVHGARGVLYWGTRYTERPSRFYNEIKRVVSELSDLAPILTARDGKKALRVEPADAPIKILVKDVSPDRWIIAVNESPKPVKAVISGLDGNFSRLAVFAEGRDVPAGGGTFRDEFTPYAVHVYSTDMKVSNIVVNPSFEKDVDDDDLPDGWDLRVPFSGGRASEERHTGQASAYLTNDEADDAVLWVQNKLPLVLGKAYRCSAWVKGNGQARVYIEWNDGKGKFAGKVPPFEPATNAWKERTFEFTAPTTAPKQIYVVLQLKGKGRVCFDDVRIGSHD